MTAYKVLLVSFFCCNVTATIVSDYYPKFHLAPPFGWMNDPNGFSQFLNEYHLFYQFNPYSSFEPGFAHWGHATSKDLFHWENQPIAMYPDQSYDKDGVFSGSALIEKNIMYLFYTGNVNHTGETPDREQRQAIAISTDGVNVIKYADNPIIIGEEFQPNIRDPKVWKYKNTYYMVLGNSFQNNTLGRVLLYSSKDKISWQQVSFLGQSDGSLGYMWECPDFFELNGRFVLLFSPQGVAAQGDNFNNLYATGYIVGTFDYISLVFKPITEFKELDHGHDFYATQTLKDTSGRRIVVAWFDMWETNYPEKADGFTGQIITPRTLTLTEDNRLLQQPVDEISVVKDTTLYCGKAIGGTTVTLEDNAAEIVIIAENKDFDMTLKSNNASLTVTFAYSYCNGTVTLDRGGNDGVRRTNWKPTSKKLLLKAYVDSSSIEVFLGEGEVTFSSRFFPDGTVQLRLGADANVDQLSVTKMKRTLYVN